MLEGQGVDRDTTNVLDIASGHRLPVGDDGQGF